MSSEIQSKPIGMFASLIVITVIGLAVATLYNWMNQPLHFLGMFQVIVVFSTILIVTYLLMSLYYLRR